MQKPTFICWKKWKTFAENPIEKDVKPSKTSIHLGAQQLYPNVLKYWDT